MPGKLWNFFSRLLTRRRRSSPPKLKESFKKLDLQPLEERRLLAIRVWDGAASMVITLVLKQSVAPFVKTVQDAMDRYKRLMVHELAATANNAHQAASQTGSLNTPTLISELERLAKLREGNHLTEQEYISAKAKLLQP